METRTKEFAWVAKLSSSNKTVKWTGKSDGTLEQIVMKMAVLGPGAKANERNLVEITTFDSEQNKIKACICALTLGCAESQSLSEVSLFPPANLTLIEGSGPVHILANHMILDEDDLSDEEDISDFEEEMLDMKRAISAKGDGPKNGKKVQVEDDEDLDDDDEYDSEDDDDVKVEELLDMEADEEEDDNDVEEEEEEDEEMQKAPTKKRKLANGSAKTEKKAVEIEKKMTSPEKGKQKKPAEQKTPKAQKNGAAPKTPKSEKKTPAKPKFGSVDEVRAAIKKFPGGKPRKQDKFLNWVENQFKVNEEAWKNDLWMWHKKEQGL